MVFDDTPLCTLHTKPLSAFTLFNNERTFGTIEPFPSDGGSGKKWGKTVAGKIPPKHQLSYCLRRRTAPGVLGAPKQLDHHQFGVRLPFHSSFISFSLALRRS